MFESPPRSNRRDGGMTLPELLISVAVLGLVFTVLSAALVATLRSTDNTEGRINVARGEQTIDFYLPNDLASAETIDTDPDTSPCGDACPANVDLNGSNALMLTWTTVSSAGTAVTNVSYYFGESSEPGVFELRRIECTSLNGGAWTCTVQIVVRDIRLQSDWGPGDPVPSDIVQISDPLAPDAVGEDGETATGLTRKDANRVIVTINGGGDAAGAGGGQNRISITAGGTTRSTIPPDSVINAPTFADARSRCGGPIVLIVDDSGSIGSSMGTVRNGIRTFVETFAGTPTQIQVVRFDTRSGVLGASGTGASGWTKYYDMTDEAQVAQLRNLIDTSSQLNADGGTNWEDAFFRSFYQQSGQDFLQVQPRLAVFFTDGEPTYERLRERATNGGDIPNQPLPEPGYPTYSGGYYSNGNEYSQVAFNRAKWVVDQIRASTKLIGVGVGSAFSQNSQWIDAPGRGWHWEYQRGYRRYQRSTPIYEQGSAFQSRVNFERVLYESNRDFERASGFTSTRDFERASTFQANLDYERASTFQSNLDYEHATGFQSNRDFERASTFQANLDFERATAFQANLDYEVGVAQSNLDFERRPNPQSNSWSDVTPTTYYTNQPGSPSLYRIRTNSNRNPSWYTVTSAEFATYSTLSPSNWRVTSWSDTTPSAYYTNEPASPATYRIDGTRTTYTVTEAEYDAYASMSPSNWQISGWSDTTPSTYYPNQPGQPAKYRINSPSNRSNSGGNTLRWFNVTEIEYDAYASLSPSNWQISGWSDVTPTVYFTNQPAQPTKYRDLTTRASYAVTEAEYEAYATSAPSNWSITTWGDVTPTVYHTNQPSHIVTYRINGTRASYAVTEAEYDAYASLSPSNWSISAWADTTPTLYYTNQPSQPVKYRINSPSNRSNSGGNTLRWFNVTEAEYDAYASLSPSNWQIAGWADVAPTVYYTNQPAQPAKYRINGTRASYAVTEAEYDAYASLLPSAWAVSGWTDITPTAYYAGQPSQPSKYRINGTRASWYSVTQAEYDAYRSASPANWRTSWTATDPTSYYTSNTAADDTDGWRINGVRGSWYTVTGQEYRSYASQSPTNWRITAWSTITQSQYQSLNTTPDESDGYRIRFASWAWISTAEYNLHNTTPDETDGYRDAGKQYVNDDNDATDWEPTTGTRTDGGYRRVPSYTEPYDFYEDAVEYAKPNRQILSRLITGSDSAVEWNGAVPGNAQTAELFILPNFNNFTNALKSVALAECGGTLTISTREGTQRAQGQFTYQNSRVADSGGTDLQVLPTVVTTSSTFPTGTFDFDVPGGSFVTVDVMPLNLSQLNGYTPGTWACKAGITPITDLELVPVNDVDNPGWSGVRVRVGANEAVSCTMTVARA